MLSNPKPNIIIQTIDSNDALIYDKIKYNTNNHWINNKCPDDYNEVLNRSDTKYWIDKFKSYKLIQIKPQYKKWLVDVSKLCSQLCKFSNLYEEELEDLLFNHSEYNHLFDGRKYFVRCSNVSLKYGQYGVGPYFDLRMIIKSLVSCLDSHSPIKPKILENDLPFDIYLIEWVDLNPYTEFRVFIHNNNMTCISQQATTLSNTIIAGLNQNQIETDYVLKIYNFWISDIKPKITHTESYSIDLAIIDDKGYFIEINSFGKSYAAGSALFHWLEDEDKLYNTTNTIYFRFSI
jgi:hypothetical protein